MSVSSRAKDHYDEIMSLFDCGHFRKEKDIWKKHQCILRNLNIEYRPLTFLLSILTLYKCILILLQFVESYINEVDTEKRIWHSILILEKSKNMITYHV